MNTIQSVGFSLPSRLVKTTQTVKFGNGDENPPAPPKDNNEPTGKWALRLLRGLDIAQNAVKKAGKVVSDVVEAAKTNPTTQKVMDAVEPQLDKAKEVAQKTLEEAAPVVKGTAVKTLEWVESQGENLQDVARKGKTLLETPKPAEAPKEDAPAAAPEANTEEKKDEPKSE